MSKSHIIALAGGRRIKVSLGAVAGDDALGGPRHPVGDVDVGHTPIAVEDYEVSGNGAERTEAPVGADGER